jgi:N-acetylglutamate synthase-like GNAT family acetyltransferase
MEFRQARAEEIPYLRDRLSDSDGEQIDLAAARVWVAVEEGAIVGMLSIRMVWQAEPLLVFAEVKNTNTRRRAGLGLYCAMEAWLCGDDNRTGIRWLFAITRNGATGGWLEKLGWLRQYIGAKTYLKHMTKNPMR